MSRTTRQALEEAIDREAARRVRATQTPEERAADDALAERAARGTLTPDDYNRMMEGA